MDGQAAGDRLPSLTGLRFVAAFAVFGFHLHLAGLFGARLERALGGVFGAGAVGVSFFFLLSGFVLAWSARPGDTAWRFWRRRLVKVWPNHMVTAVAAFVVLAAAGTAPSLAAVVCNVTLTQAWVPVQWVYFGLNLPSWSLSCEAMFYVCFPLLLRGVESLRGRWLWPVTIAGFAAVWAAPAAAVMLPLGYRYWVVYIFPPTRMVEFMVGILLARIVREGYWIRFGVLPAAGLAVAAYAVADRIAGPYSYVAITVVPLGLLIAAVAAGDVAGRRSLLGTPMAVRLGELSFAFYLVHRLVTVQLLGAFGQHGRSTWMAAGMALAAFAGSLGAAWLLWRLVERPAMRFARPRKGIAQRSGVSGERSPGEIGLAAEIGIPKQGRSVAFEPVE